MVCALPRTSLLQSLEHWWHFRREVSAQSTEITGRQQPSQPQSVCPAAIWQKIQKYPLPYHRTTGQLLPPDVTLLISSFCTHHVRDLQKRDRCKKCAGKSVLHRHISKYSMYTLQFRQMCREETAIRLLQEYYCGCKVDILCWMIKEQQALGFLQCICSPPLSFLPLFFASSQQSATREQTEMEMREGAAKDTLITHTGILNLSLSVYLPIFHSHSEHKPLEMPSPNALAWLMHNEWYCKKKKKRSKNTVE